VINEFYFIDDMPLLSGEMKRGEKRRGGIFFRMGNWERKLKAYS